MLNKYYQNWTLDKKIIVKPYFNNMISVLKSADIVISRAGSLSISEICASEVAPILVPYPYAAANHQSINAKSLLDKGACIYIDDNELEPNMLRNTIFELESGLSIFNPKYFFQIQHPVPFSSFVPILHAQKFCGFPG